MGPNLIFVYKLYILGALVPQFVTPLPTRYFVWLGVDKGCPPSHGERMSISFERRDTLLKLMSFWVTWVLLIALQGVHLVPLIILITMHLPLSATWLVLGFFLHQTKSLSIGKVWTWWFRILTGTNKYE